MTMAINRLSSPPLDALYFEDDFTLLVETHLDWLKRHPQTQVLTVDPHATFKYAYDFYGYLFEAGVPAQLHWTIMRVNGLTAPHEFDRTFTQMVVPSVSAINTLRQLYLTSRTTLKKK